MSYLLRDRAISIGTVTEQPPDPEPDGKSVTDVFIRSMRRTLDRVTDAKAIIQMVTPIPEDMITLVGVNEIKFNFSSDIAVEQGIVSSIMQPWYIKPAEISISGTSYLGAYPIVQRRDYDAENIYGKYLKTLNEFGSKSYPGTKDMFQLKIKNNPTNADEFYGYIRKFEFQEVIEKPYVLAYTIDFVGKPSISSVIDMSIAAALSDVLGIKRK